MTKFVIIFIACASMAWAAVLFIPEDFATIQEGINAAEEGDTVLVSPGRYFEQINFNGKSLLLASLYTTTGYPGYITATLIDGSGSGSVVTFNHNEGPESIIAGFSITNGLAANGGGLFISQSSPTIKNCLISGNLADGNGGGMVCYFTSRPLLLNTTLSGNSAGANGGGIFCRDNSRPGFVNSIVFDNFLTDGTADNIDLNLGGSIVLAYTTLQGGEQGIISDSGLIFYLNGNLESDPQFINPAEGNFTLSADSPCVDGGIAGTVLYFNDAADSLQVPDIAHAGGAPDQGAFEQWGIEGCTDFQALNFQPQSTIEDGSCLYAPQLSSLDDVSMTEDSLLQILLSATDQNVGDELTFSADTDTMAISVTVQQDTLTLSPAADWYGSGVITVWVSDGQYSDSTDFQLTVTPVNDPPQLDCNNGAVIAENSILADYQLAAEDVDGDTLHYAIEITADYDNFPWVTDPFSWSLADLVLTITPPLNWYGEAAVQFWAGDTELADSCSFTLTVLSAENDAYLSIGEINYSTGSFGIQLYNQLPVSGFQFDIIDPHYLTIEDVYGGSAGDHDFVLQFEPSLGTVLGFSQVLDAIPPGDTTLVYVQFSGWGNAQTCLENITATAPDGTEAFSIPGECLTLNFEPGDVNHDEAMDILDVVEIVAVILGQIDPTEYELWAADMNSDAEINVSDVILLIDLIMEY